MTRHERQIFLLGYRIGANLTAQRMADDMSKFHDDLLAKAKTLTESARKAAAAQTELQQSFTDVSRELDEATKLLEDMLKDDASQGSSTGGEPAPQATAAMQVPAPQSQDASLAEQTQHAANQQRQAQQPTQKLREKDGGQWSAR